MAAGVRKIFYQTINMSNMIKYVMTVLAVALAYAAAYGQQTDEDQWIKMSDKITFEKNCNSSYEDINRLRDIAINCEGVMMGYTQHWPKRTHIWCEMDKNILLVSRDNGRSWKDITENMPFVRNERTLNLLRDPSMRWAHYNWLNVLDIFSYGDDFYICIGDVYRQEKHYGNYLVKTSDLGESWEFVFEYDGVADKIIINGDGIYKRATKRKVGTFVGEDLMKWTGNLENPSWEVIETLEKQGYNKVYIKKVKRKDVMIEIYRYKEVLLQNRLYSYDKGETWKQGDFRVADASVSLEKDEIHIADFVQCGDLTIAKGTLKQDHGEWLIGNDIREWQPFSIGPDFKSIPKNNFYSHLAPDGKLLLVDNGVLYKSKRVFDCGCFVKE